MLQFDRSQPEPFSPATMNKTADTIALTQAFRLGELAYQSRIEPSLADKAPARAANPYAPGTDLHSAWRAGYAFAQEHAAPY